MKKVLSLLTAVVMIVGITAASGGSSVRGATAAKPTQFRASLPDFQKLDKDFTQEEYARTGVKPVGKELHGYNGNAYIKPDTLNPLGSIDVRGKDHKGIAILVDFPVTQGEISDVPGVKYGQVPSGKFDDLLNGLKYDPYDLEQFKWLERNNGVKASTNHTLKTYYNEVSYNQFGITVDVVDWITLPNPYDYYLGQDKPFYNDNGDAFVGELVSDAIEMAVKAGVDFSDYAVDAKPGDFADLYGNETSFKDINGNLINKIIPNIFIIHRGTGSEYSADPSIIWSHKWDILSANYYGQYYRNGYEPDESTLSYKIVDGAVVNTYNICPEVGQNITGFNLPEPRKPSPAYVGVYAHEFGHVLGLPDLYDYGYDSEGIGMFTLMASGSYGRDIQDRWYSGNSPVHLDAWSKIYLGFVKPELITNSTGGKNITLKPASSSPDVVKIVVPVSNGREYFLLENRQQQGFDKGLAYNVDTYKLHGLVVYHVDEDVLTRNFHRPNEAANWAWNSRGANYKDPTTGENHYAISVVQADGRWDMEKNTNDGDSTDTFGTVSGVRKLSPNPKSTPNTLSYYKWGNDSRSATGITLDNINEKYGIVTLDVSFSK